MMNKQAPAWFGGFSSASNNSRAEHYWAAPSTSRDVDGGRRGIQMWSAPSRSNHLSSESVSARRVMTTYKNTEQQKKIDRRNKNSSRMFPLK